MSIAARLMNAFDERLAAWLEEVTAGVRGGLDEFDVDLATVMRADQRADFKRAAFRLAAIGCTPADVDVIVRGIQSGRIQIGRRESNDG